MAKYMMKMFAIILVRYFDLRAQDEGDFELPSENPRSVGVMLPNRQVLVHLQRRWSWDEI